MDVLKYLFFIFLVSIALQGEAAVDLVPECSFSPDDIFTTTQIGYSVKVYNRGDEAVSLSANMVWAKQELIEGTLPGYENQPYIRSFTVYSPTSLAAGSDYHSGGNYYRPYQLPTGSYLYRVTSDPNNLVLESNEDNNTAECRLDIADGGQPNLIIRDIQTRERTLPNGEKSYDVYVYYKNIGTGNAYFAYNDRMLSCGRLGDKDSTPSSTIILPGEEKYAWFVINSPIPGEHSISCSIDSANKIPEQDESDNQFQASLVVAETTGETGLPDLGQLECQISNLDRLNNSERVMLGFKSINIGTKSLNLPYNSRYAREELVNTSSGITRTILSPFGISFPPGDSLSAGQYWGILDAGDYIYKVTLNPFSDFEESDLNNNVIECPLHVADQRPEVFIDQVLVTPEHPNETSSIRIDITIKNQGLVRANFPWQAHVLGCPGLAYLDANNQAIIIEPGATYTHRAYLSNKAPGNYNYLCTLDPDNRVPEIDENNNLKPVVFVVEDSTRRPDLIIHSGTFIQETGLISLTVKNQGTAETTGLFQLNISGAPLAFTNQLSYLGVGEERTLTLHPQVLGLLLGQNYNLSATVDPNNSQTELNESNNTHEFTINMPQPRADLIVSSLEVAGGMARAKVKNQGALASTSNYLRFTLNGKMAIVYVRSLAINEEISVGITLARFALTLSGDYILKAQADVYQSIVESDETNNTLERSILFDLANFPDLIISSLSLSSSNVILTIKNQGLSASPAFYLRVQGHLSKYVLRYVSALAPGASTSLSLLRTQFTTTGAQSFTLTATVDYANLVAEKNELNNTRSLLFPANQVVGLPDLTISDVSVSLTHLKVEVKNMSSSIVSGNYLKATLNGQTRYFPVAPMLANAVTYVSIPKNYFTSLKELGSNVLVVQADAFASIKESREDNNSLSKSF